VLALGLAHDKNNLEAIPGWSQGTAQAWARAEEVPRWGPVLVLFFGGGSPPTGPGSSGIVKPGHPPFGHRRLPDHGFAGDCWRCWLYRALPGSLSSHQPALALFVGAMVLQHRLRRPDGDAAAALRPPATPLAGPDRDGIGL